MIVNVQCDSSDADCVAQYPRCPHREVHEMNTDEDEDGCAAGSCAAKVCDQIVTCIPVEPHH